MCKIKLKRRRAQVKVERYKLFTTYMCTYDTIYKIRNKRKQRPAPPTKYFSRSITALHDLQQRPVTSHDSGDFIKFKQEFSVSVCVCVWKCARERGGQKDGPGQPIIVTMNNVCVGFVTETCANWIKYTR